VCRGCWSKRGLLRVAPFVTAVIAGFGKLWKLGSDEEALDYVRAHPAHLEPLLLFELVHEGEPASWMRRIAALGGLENRFETWARRLQISVATPTVQAQP